MQVTCLHESLIRSAQNFREKRTLLRTYPGIVEAQNSGENEDKQCGPGISMTR
jgi:hypothetical protein